MASGSEEKTDESSGVTGKTVIISGVSRGIGRGLAIEFIERGWNIGGFARNKKDLDSLEAAIKSMSSYSKNKSKLYFECVDVTDYEKLKLFRDNAIKALGVPQLLVANAGVSHSYTLIEDFDPKFVNKLLDINTKGVFYLIMLFIGLMKKDSLLLKNKDLKYGIFPISSMVAKIPFAGTSLYAASKHALNGVIGCIRKENEAAYKNIIVANYDPGLVATDLLAHGTQVDISKYDDTITPQLASKVIVDDFIGILNDSSKYDLDNLTAKTHEVYPKKFGKMMAVINEIQKQSK